jgi:DNA-binding PadR family transcriptional regulator
MLMESQDESVYRLTDEQVEEVRRRMADPNRKLISVAKARERLARLGSKRGR